MFILLNYIFLGLSLAAPIGPVNAAQLDRGLRNGFVHAWLVGLGATTADAIYMLVVYLGFVNFINVPFVKAFLFLFGCFVLIYTGIESLMAAKRIALEQRGESDTYFKCFLSGFLLSLSNPLTILFWLGIYGSVLAKASATYDKVELIVYSGAIFVGILLWDLTMAIIASTFRRYFAHLLLTITSIISGISLIGFGSYFGYEAVQLFTR
ncbi:LysE family transporter [Bacillus sp. CGMCC 1.16541]|uniref:LysE family transporter n=1 Tax=Bacillus sp. CGMCC 1.16541 TaxID=2185143 RepID=UPI000D72E248|nr:LysE family transporter [Bacillus sp. CGMCC 1.16541]